MAAVAVRRRGTWSSVVKAVCAVKDAGVIGTSGDGHVRSVLRQGIGTGVGWSDEKSWEMQWERVRKTRMMAMAMGAVVGGAIAMEARLARCDEDNDMNRCDGADCARNGGMKAEQNQQPGNGGQKPPASNEHTARWRIFTDRARALASRAARSGDATALREAQGLMRAALQEAEAGFGTADPHVAAAMSNLAEVHRLAGNAEEAERLYLEAIARLEAAYGEEPLHPSVGAALHNLGGFYLFVGDGDKAQKALARALKAKLHALGRTHPEYARTLFFMGEALRMQHDASPVTSSTAKLEEAVAMLREGLDIMSDLGAGSTDASVRQMLRLVELLCRCGQKKQAEALVQHAGNVMKSASFPSRAQAGASERMEKTMREWCKREDDDVR